jgi:hypothetical protein
MSMHSKGEESAASLFRELLELLHNDVKNFNRRLGYGARLLRSAEGLYLCREPKQESQSI